MTEEFSCPDSLKKYRVLLFGEFGDDKNGALLIKPRGLKVVFASGGGWEHVSVSKQFRAPSYEEMDRIKREFWPPNAVVMQLHVSADTHVNIAENCLHLWRPLTREIPLPPVDFV